MKYEINKINLKNKVIRSNKMKHRCSWQWMPQVNKMDKAFYQKWDFIEGEFSGF